jgi:hypothetical protein
MFVVVESRNLPKQPASSEVDIGEPIVRIRTVHVRLPMAASLLLHDSMRGEAMKENTRDRRKIGRETREKKPTPNSVEAEDNDSVHIDDDARTLVMISLAA